jgi:hypothetical protein
MIKYLVKNTADKTTATIGLDVAAKLSQLSADDILLPWMNMASAKPTRT